MKERGKELVCDRKRKNTDASDTQTGLVHLSFLTLGLVPGVFLAKRLLTNILFNITDVQSFA